MGNTLLLTRMIHSLMTMVMNCSASRGGNNCQCMQFWNFNFEIVIFCCIVVGSCFSISEAQFRYACARFSPDLTIFLVNGG